LRTAFCPTCGDAITDYCSAVTLEREDNTSDHPFKPWFRWLDSSVPDEGWGPARVAQRDVSDPDNETDYRNPKCAALWGDYFIELAVCYQIRNSEENDNEDWDIGVTRLLWYDDGQQYYSQFPDLGPALRIDVVLNDPPDQPQWDEMNPDIAYDYTNGDIYLVYENSETAGTPIDPTLVRLKYRRFARNQINHRTGLWPANDGEWFAQTHEGINAHNGYTPSIEVGLLDLSLVGVPQDDVNYVVIAYTSQLLDHLGYHVCVTAWDTSTMNVSRDTSIQLRNPDFAGQNAGVPCVSITPPINQVNFAAIVFQQIVQTDAYGPVNRIYEVDMTNWNAPAFRWNYFDVQAAYIANHDDGLYPAIALHEETYVGVGYLITNASITYLAQTAQQAQLQPYVVRMAIVHPQNSTPPPPPWTHLIGYNAPIPIVSPISGNYNIDHIPILDPGASSSVVFGQDAEYWAAWCDRIEMEDPPETVWASYGDTAP
jgi:hypothetical protein